MRLGTLLVSAALAGCFKSGDFLAGPTGNNGVERQVLPGTVDTLALPALGAYLSVDARTISTPLRTRVEEVAEGLEPGIGGLSPTIRLRFEGTSTGASAASAIGGTPRRSVGDEFARIKLFLKSQAGVDVLRDVALRPSDIPGGTTLFWTSPTRTTYIDPQTGATISVEVVDLDVPATGISETLLQIARRESDCGLPSVLSPYDGDPNPGTRIPLILIHGWQPDMIHCQRANPSIPDSKSYEDYTVNTFNNLIGYLQTRDALGLLGRYKIYVLKYPTFTPVLQTSQFLRGELLKLQSEGAQPPVLLGHSMGGLVARGMMTLPSPPSVRGIVTLGTPHEGSPFGALINGTSPTGAKSWRDAAASCGAASWVLYSLGVSLFAKTDGTTSLDPNDPFIGLLQTNHTPQEKIFTFGGQLTASDLSVLSGAWEFSQIACILASLNPETASDGIVPVSSALPTWTAVQGVLQHHDHGQMVDGRSGDELFTRVGAVLDLLSMCDPATPAPPTHNEIILSGSIARAGERKVDVTLNAIIMDGVVQRNLTKANFQIIENDCTLSAFDITTASGSVGVDLVFAQDLSGSMGAAINGVRSSVVTFAQNLDSRGLNVRFGSIGYSGPGGIPTTPATSPCEFLGPFQEPTTVLEFQAHVQSSWYLGSGCDSPENGLEAIEYAHQHVEWRPGAARVYIDITDASHHTSATNCNGVGACTDESLSSITSLLGGTSVIHAVAAADAFARTVDGGLDPWLLADATGGQKLILPSDGSVDLNALNIADVIGETVRLTFTSASIAPAPLNLRVRVMINGKIGELSPGLLTYAPIDASLRH